MIRARKAFLFAPLLMAACDASGASHSELTIETDTSGSFPVITSSGIPPDWNLELVASIGAMIARLPIQQCKEHAAPFFGHDYFVAIRLDSLDLDHVDVYRIDER